MAFYQRLFEESGEGIGDTEDAVPQKWIIGNVDQCVDEIMEFVTTFGVTDIVTMAVPPGLRPENMASSLERLFKEVVPRVKARSAEIGGMLPR